MITNLPWMLIEWLVVHQTVDLTDPLDQLLDASNAVAPLGCPLGQEDCHMYWITVSRHCTLGNCSGKLEVFVKKDWFKFDIWHPLVLGGRS